MENEEEFNLTDIDEEAGSNMEEEFDISIREGISMDNEEKPGSSHISVDLSQAFNSQQMGSYEVRIDMGVGGEPLDADQTNEVPNDEARDGEISIDHPDAEVQNDEYSNQHDVPLLANSNNTLRRRARPTNMVDNCHQWSISVVPPHFREVDGMAYTPKFVSIGPIHRKKSNLLLMEEEKKQFRECLLNEKNQECSNTLIKVVREMESKVRRYYLMAFQEMSSDDFVDMVLNDGCFIVLLFCLNYKRHKGGGISDPIFSTRWMLPNIGRDLLLIENQLPLFVLEKLFNMTKLIPDASFTEVALEFIKSYHIGKDEIIIKEHHVQGHHKHLLDLYQSLYIPEPPKTSDSSAVKGKRRKKKVREAPNLQGKNWVLSATALKSAGVDVSARAGKPLDIMFRSGALRIPSISIDESSIIILKNLLAYEQSSRNVEPYFTTLVLFFSSIASVPEDVKLLRERAIIQHQPSDDQMLIEVLNLLSKQLECDVTDCLIKKQVEDIRAYCDSELFKFWNSIGRILAQNVFRFFLLYLSLVLTFSVHRFRI